MIAIAAGEGKLEVVKYLVEQGVDMDQFDEVSNYHYIFGILCSNNRICLQLAFRTKGSRLDMLAWTITLK